MSLPPCPHPGDDSHGGLGKAWCDAGREGQARVAAKRAKEAKRVRRELCECGHLYGEHGPRCTGLDSYGIQCVCPGPTPHTGDDDEETQAPHPQADINRAVAKQAKRARLRAGADMSSKRLRLEAQAARRVAAEPDASTGELLAALIRPVVVQAVEGAVVAVARKLAELRDQ